jgi:tRNA A-37 threonylcarbamoyl transferase component Bud32
MTAFDLLCFIKRRTLKDTLMIEASEAKHLGTAWGLLFHRRAKHGSLVVQNACIRQTSRGSCDVGVND